MILARNATGKDMAYSISCRNNCPHVRPIPHSLRNIKNAGTSNTIPYKILFVYQPQR
jgi:hypothetical protein